MGTTTFISSSSSSSSSLTHFMIRTTKKTTLPHLFPKLTNLLKNHSTPLFSLSSIRSSMSTDSQSDSTPTPTPTPSSPISKSTKTVRVMIKGRVQGVFYRNWTVENARGLGLKGWVRNRRDGSVEALFSGEKIKVDEMEQRCRRGPPDAMVTGFQVFLTSEDPGNGFEKKPTI